MTTVLVTGANSGIGTAAVKALGAGGAHVIATVRSDRSEAQLREALIGDGERLPEWLTIERLDVTDVEDAKTLMERCRPDVLVNNAGEVLLGGVGDVEFVDAHRQLLTSVLAPVFLARAAIEVGSCRRVINIGSVVSEGVIPFTGWYGASKAALDVISDVWRVELAPHGVRLVVIECGAVDTDAWDRAGEQVANDGDPSTARARERWADLTGVLKRGFGEPEEVADAILSAALDDNPPATMRVGFGARMIPAVGWIPRQIREPIAKVMFGLTHRRGH